MSLDRLLKLGYALFALKGLLAIVTPRTAIRLATSVWRAGFENVGDLEPREWYVDATRATGVGMLVAGLTGLVLTAAGEDATDGAGDDDADADDDDPDSGAGNGPIRVDVD